MSDEQVIKSRVLNKPLPTAEYLRECFVYDADAGVLIWKERPQSHFATLNAQSINNSRFAGTIAGHVNGKKGYSSITVGRDTYKTARLIWKWVTGEEPPREIDHKDRNPGNNRWTNLRESSPREQSYNRVRVDNVTGYRGVAPHGTKFRAMIMWKGVVWSSSYFSTPEEASAAYEEMAELLQGEYYIRQA
jgi:hypothetical protein